MKLPTTAAVLVLASLAGCASVPDGSILTGPDGSMTATSQAETEPAALAGATAQARAACRALAMQERVTARATRALGVPARTTEPAAQAAALALYVGATAFPSLAATDDVEASVRFTCIAPPAAVAAR